MPDLESPTVVATDVPLLVGGIEYRSRLLVGTGKYKDMTETADAIEASGAEIVTVAIRRTNIGQDAKEPNLLDVISPNDHTAGIRGEGQSRSSWSKLEEKLPRQPGDSFPGWIVGILYVPAVASIAWSAIYC